MYQLPPLPVDKDLKEFIRDLFNAIEQTDSFVLKDGDVYSEPVKTLIHFVEVELIKRPEAVHALLEAQLEQALKLVEDNKLDLTRLILVTNYRRETGFEKFVAARFGENKGLKVFFLDWGGVTAVAEEHFEVVKKYYLEFKNLPGLFHTFSPEEELAYWQYVSEVKKNLFGAYSIEHRYAYGRLADAHQGNGNYEQALSISNDTLEFLEKQTPLDYNALAATYTRLAMIYNELGELNKALESQLKGLDIIENKLGKDFFGLVISYDTLAKIYFNLGNYPHALQYFLKSISVAEKILSPYDHELAAMYNNLARAYQRVNNIDEAINYQVKAVAIAEKIYPSNHPNLAISYANLYKSYFSNQQYFETQVYAQKTIRALEEKFPDHDLIKDARKFLKIIDSKVENPELIVSTGDRKYKEFKAIKIHRLKIQNIKCFEDIDIEFNTTNNTALIIGTNARGKSTILQLLALGLYNLELPPTTHNWLGVVRKGANTGKFQIEVKHGEKLLNYEYEVNQQDKIVLKGEFSYVLRENLVLLAYGSTRAIRREEARPMTGFEWVATLFGENSYLKNIKDSDTYQYTEDNFEIIRPLINSVFIEADPQNPVSLESYDSHSFYFKTPGNPIDTISLEALSDGFKATFVWLFDMMIRIVEAGYNIGNVDQIVGIVLLDEIDLHLHPKWQRTILPSLEKLLPSVQFIVTTHSPFVVQSVETDNIIKLKYDETVNSVGVENAEVTKGSSYEAITKELFGIEEIFDVETEAQFADFYKMRDEIMKDKRDINDEEFKDVVRKLNDKTVEVKAILGGEIRQLSRFTGKEFSL